MPLSTKPPLQMSREELSKILDYNPSTGDFTWLVRQSNNVKAGHIAGSVRTDPKWGKPYRNVFVKGRAISAARLAWFMHYGEWPEKQVRYKNGDTIDTRIDNLTLAEFVHDKKVQSDGSVKYTKTRDASRQYHLKGTFGLSLTEYAEMYAAQNGVCAICGQPETMVRHGKVQPLAVDHCHAKGHVRKLLCHECNHGLGKFKDNPELLRRAAEYLEDH